MFSKFSFWAWSIGSAVATGLLGVLMFSPEGFDIARLLPLQRTVFLPGATTSGHYQIELACESCHEERFASAERMQDACVGCHGGELERADDSHPRTKFTDPRNADRVAALDARYCVTCHREHRPEITGAMGLSLPGDYCYRCHQSIGEDRPTHRELAFDTCASAGCHNFHDNRALYEDFLVEHRDDPDTRAPARVVLRDMGARAREQGLARSPALGANDHDAPADLPELDRWIEEWSASSHAAAGVNCRDCHAPEGAAWSDETTLEACQRCHEHESEGFLASRHGMRMAAGLPPMTPGQARIPMRSNAGDRVLGCATCHGAHAFDTRRAAATACLECHADDHSLAYEGSPHHRLWQAEQNGELPAGSGVSCATCHLPRIHDERVPDRVLVAHNQNDFLRPNEKMIRAACLSCHGLALSIDALADPALVANNFRSRPNRHIQSLYFATVLRWEREGRTPPWQRKEHPEP